MKVKKVGNTTRERMRMRRCGRGEQNGMRRAANEGQNCV
jgi:hypothetical protein